MKVNFRADFFLAATFALLVIAVSWMSGLNTLIGTRWAILSTGAIALFAAVVGYQLYRWKPRTVLAKRKPLSIPEIYEQNYAGSNIPRITFEKHWKAIAAALHESAESLRPQDRFEVELQVGGHLDFSIDEVADYAQQILGLEFDLRSTPTLDKLIRELCAHKGPIAKG